MSCVRLRNGQELVCLSSTTGGSSGSSMRLQMFGTNLLQRAEWQGYTAFLQEGVAEQDLACPEQQMLPPTSLS